MTILAGRGRLKILCLGAALVLVAGCGDGSLSTAPGGGATGAASLESEQWYALFLRGQRVGYAHTVVRPQRRGTDQVLRIENEEVMTLEAYGNVISMRSESVSIETLDGRLIEFSSTLPQGDPPMKTTGSVVGNELKLQVSTTGKTIEESIPWSDEYGGLYALAGSLRREPLQPGQKRTIRALDGGSNQLATTTLEAADYEETELLGESRRLLRVAMTTTMAGQQIEGTLWIDPGGEVYKNQVAAVLGYEAILTNRQTATEEVRRTDFDLGIGSAVAVDRRLDSPHKTRRIVYRVELADADPAKVFDSGLTQKVVSTGEHTAEITVFSVRPGSATGNPGAPPEPVTDADLAPNSLIQSDDQKIVRLGQEVAGAMDDPWQAAQALERYVNRNMTSGGISSAFSTAAEVAQQMRGDCTEHAVLLAALARSRGIPARVAIGLVYYQGKFLYHMWTEVHIGSEWVPIDATLGLGGIGAAHLKITDNSLEGASPQASFLPVTRVIGQLKIEIVSVE